MEPAKGMISALIPFFASVAKEEKHPSKFLGYFPIRIERLHQNCYLSKQLDLV